MPVLELKKDIYWNGVLDPDLRVFDIIMHTEFGTTYNSYVVKGSEKTALIETAKLKFFDQYLKTVEQITEIKNIDYIVVNHTEPDHAGSIAKLIELNPCITVIGTAVAINNLKNIVNTEFGSFTVKDGDTVSLGNKTLRFLSVPNLHWPDTMYTYVIEDNLLFTCDSFGSHYSHDKILRSTVSDTEGYMRATKYYFDNIIGPFKNPFMSKALEKIKPLKIDMICTGHGPVLDSNIDELIQIYTEWCAPAPRPQAHQIVIAYVSAYGYTKELAQTISTAITQQGNFEIRLYDMVDADHCTVVNDILSSDGFLLGTPTILGDALAPIWALAGELVPVLCKGKIASAFGSYGWSGEGVPHIIERLKQLKITVLDGYAIKFKPSESELDGARNFAKSFAESVLKAK